jgi:hypothetical protein
LRHLIEPAAEHATDEVNSERVLVAQALLPVRVLRSAHSQPLAAALDKGWLRYYKVSRIDFFRSSLSNRGSRTHLVDFFAGDASRLGIGRQDIADCGHLDSGRAGQDTLDNLGNTKKRQATL